MDGLRWILLAIGVLIIAGVYLYSRRESDRKKNEPAPQVEAIDRREPVLTAEPVAESVDDPAPMMIEPELGEPETADAVEAQSAPADAPQKIVTMRIVARGKPAFPGDELALSLRGIGMRHGKFGIFHRYDGNDEDRVVFSAASLVEPGSFDLANLKKQEIPGISLFMVLPGPIDGAEAFDLMMVAARALAQSLDAELLDESGSTLSIQRERYLREEIVQFQTTNRIG